MSIMQKIMETVVQYMPDKEPDPLIRQKHGYVGKPFSRVDGQLKVKGEAVFTAEFNPENMAYAALVYSTIARGRIAGFDLSKAEKAAGVIKIITYENAPKMKAPQPFDLSGSSGKNYSAGSTLPIMQSAEIHWNGEPVAVVVAETLDQAEHAAALVKVSYQKDEAATSFEGLMPEAVVPDKVLNEEPEVKVGGDAETALADSEISVDNVYKTPRNNQNALELHATVADWRGEGTVTVFDTTQYLYGIRDTVADIFGLEPEKVRVIAPFVGGGFGGKCNLWNNTALCVAASKETNRPVKLVVSRAGVFRIVGARMPSEQRVALGASRDGKLNALIHTGTTATTKSIDYAEQVTFPARHMYAAENIYIQQKVVYLDMVANTWMRAPGEGTGTFALESAMDELAYALKIDPVELRRINEPEKDPTTGHEFSERSLNEAYKRGAEKFGWQWREPNTQKDGKWLVGQGVASAYYPVGRIPATARIRISKNGTALVQAAAHEMGMGTATVQIQHAAERLGLPIDRVQFEYGDSNLPQSPVAGGSNQTVSIATAVQVTAEKLLKELLAVAGDNYDSPLSGVNYEDIEPRDNGIFVKNSDKGETYEQILSRLGQDYYEAEETSGMPMELMKYSMASYGAHFCEVRIHEDTGETRISRWLGSFDCGKILNAKTASSQFRGGIIMGIGMALHEETFFDERVGRIANPGFGDYHFPAHLDVPHLDVIYNDIPDEHTALGAHGVGEIGITGAAAAVANAVYNATGKRIRELPITLDKLL